MLDKLTIDSFRPYIDTSFWVMPNPQNKVEIRLIAAANVMESEAARLNRIPFSLHFFGPKSFLLEQKTYRLEHDTLEPMELFLVPIGEENGGYLYEAVFT